MVHIRKTAGFTLLEILIALAAFTIVIAAVFEFYISQNKALFVQEQIVEMEQNARSATNMIHRELRMAGYKAMGSTLLNNLSNWLPSSYIPTVPYTVNLDGNPKVTTGSGSDPDMITFLSVLTSATNPATISSGASVGATSITLSLTSSETSDQYAIGDILNIGTSSEYATVTNISGSTLTIDTNPNPTPSGNQGLADSYASGEPAGEISVVTYAVFNSSSDSSNTYHTQGHPALKRKVNDGDYVTLAENVTDMQILNIGNGEIKITISVRTDISDSDYSGDGYRTIDMVKRIKIRNTDSVGEGSTCSVPGQATLTSATGLDGTYPCQIGMQWSSVSAPETGCDVTDYMVFYDTTQGSYGNSTAAGNVTEYALSISPGNCTYYVSVAAVNSGGTGAKSSEQSVSDSTSPASATSFTATVAPGGETLYNQASLTWAESSSCDVSGYDLYRSIDGGTSYTKINSTTLTGTTYSDMNLKSCNNPHYYKIMTKDYCSLYVYSSPVSVSINDFTAPPTNLQISSTGSNDTLTWTASEDEQDAVDAVVSYRIYGDSSPTPFDTEAATGADTYTYSLSSGTYTAYSISALDNCGNESSKVAILSTCVSSPTVSISTPLSGATVSGSVTVSGTASVPSGRTFQGNITLTIVNNSTGDETSIDTGGQGSWSYAWNSDNSDDGEYTITAEVTDDAGCSSTAAVTLTVEHCSETPTVTLTSPADGDTVSGQTVSVAGQASVPSGRTFHSISTVPQMRIDLDDWVDASFTDPDWSYSWNSESYSDGQHTIEAAAVDNMGCVGYSDTVTVWTSNAVCTLEVELAACKPSGNRQIYASILVKLNGTPVTTGDGVTVTWEIQNDTGDTTLEGPWTLTDISDGYYYNTTGTSACGSFTSFFAKTSSSIKFQDSALPLTIKVTAIKTGCAGSPDTETIVILTAG